MLQRIKIKIQILIFPEGRQTKTKKIAKHLTCAYKTYIKNIKTIFSIITKHGRIYNNKIL